MAFLGALTLLVFLDGSTPHLEFATFFRLQYAFLLGAAALAAISPPDAIGLVGVSGIHR